MNMRKSLSGLGFLIALGAPLAALAGGFWETTDDEAGSRIVAPQFGNVAKSAPLAAVNPLRPGDVSPDRQYVYLGEGGGWQLRPMQYRFEHGRLVHVDDPAGHMNRVADTRPLTEQQRVTLQRSAGN